MKRIAMTAGAIAILAATSVFAQDNSDRNYPYDPDQVAREQAREAWRDREWNDNRSYRPYSEPRYERDGRRYGDMECWNPHAGHFEAVRRGEVQNDLDFSRCRSTRAYGPNR